MLELHFMGTPRVMINGEEVTANLSRKAIGILAYLVQNRDQPVSRERLAFLFWNESSRDRGKYNFRHTLWAINKLLKNKGMDPAFIRRGDNDSCTFVTDDNWTADVVELEEGIRRGADCGALFKGEFLRDLRIRDNPEIDEWIAHQRERIQKVYFEKVSQLARIHTENQHFSSAEACVEKLLSLNPLQEELHLQLMKIHLMDGNRVKATQQYEKCREVLRRELNLSPMEEINALYRQIIQENPAVGEKTKQTDHEASAHPPFFYLSRLVENIYRKAPQLVKNLPDPCYAEIAKLLIELQVSGAGLSPDVERLRIFKAVAFLLDQLYIRSIRIKPIEDRAIDQVSRQFLSLYHRKVKKVFRP